MVTLKEIYIKADPNGDMLNVDSRSLEGLGGAFLAVQIGEGNVFSREQFSEEHKMFRQTAIEFGEDRILLLCS